jgi:ubiquinone/menaquinone biosynthesis C-methylase UbiE
MADAFTRFSGFASEYDAVRPKPPAELVELLTAWSGTRAPDVADLGAGTGLSTAMWLGTTAQVIALEPNDDMRTVAAQRIQAANVTFGAATAEQTGLPDEAVDVVTVGQAMHWFDPAKALPEIARILRRGGVFAAFDCDWPPTMHPAVDAAYLAAEQRWRDLAKASGFAPERVVKTGHLQRLRDSGLFSLTREIALHSTETGGPDRIVGIMNSQSGVVELKRHGHTDEELGIAELDRVAREYLTDASPWWWTYRIRLAIRS